MQFNHTLSAILRGRWFINKPWADAHVPLIISMLNGNTVSFIERTGNQGVELPFAIDPATMQRYDLNAYNPQNGKMVPNPNIPPNSVGILPITGPVTKYNGDCGEPGAIAKNSWLLDFAQRDNIGSVILLMDTPGGEGRAADTLTATIQKFKKPILSYVDGMCASLGVWYSSASDEVYLGSDMAEVGSVGSYCTLLDFSGYLEQNGIKMTEIYAPQSTDKNKDYRDALAGNTSAIEADLKLHVDAFIKSVANSGGNTMRSDTARANMSQWSSGKMFYAKDAIKVGLADGIKPLDQVVSKAAWLAKRN